MVAVIVASATGDGDAAASCDESTGDAERGAGGNEDAGEADWATYQAQSQDIQGPPKTVRRRFLVIMKLSKHKNGHYGSRKN